MAEHGEAFILESALVGPHWVVRFES